MRAKARTELYPKRGKPHIYKDKFGYNLCWVPGTVRSEKLSAAIEYVNKLSEKSQ